LIHREAEIKLRVERPSLFKARLRDLGAVLLRSRHFEDNHIMDFEDERLRRSNSLLRLRIAGKKAYLTFKGPSRILSGTKARREMESELIEGRTVLRILYLLRLRCHFRYQKHRTIFRLSRTMITLDETPIGNYAEIEGEPVSIKRIAKKLGFEEKHFITDTYLELFNKYRNKNRVRSRHMKFGIKAHSDH
jgi:adenylate cyclase class 2